MRHSTLPTHVRAKGDGRTIEMRAVTYGVVDTYRSVFVRPFGEAALRERLPVIAWAHSWDEPIGRATSYRVADDGIYITARLSDPDAVPRARQAIAQIGDGTLTDVSIGFSEARRRTPSPEEERRWPGAEEVIYEGRIAEVSLVLEGAVGGAQVLALRSAPGVSRRRAELIDRMLDMGIELGRLGRTNPGSPRRRELSDRLNEALRVLDRIDGGRR